MSPAITGDQLLETYKQSCIRTYKLLHFALDHYLTVASFALKEAEHRSGKLLANEDDKAFEGILYTNELTQSLVTNKYWLTEKKRLDIKPVFEEDILRNIYNEFSKTDDYITYWKETKDHSDILLKLLRFTINHPHFEEIMEDAHAAWVDDKSLILGSLKKIIKALPLREDFYSEFMLDESLIDDFGRNMLLAVWNQDDELTESISPTLKNWDIKRVATLDLLILKMAVCEFIYFPTIPTKVTLNEFVEIAKQYSTDKSKDFINGILDRLMKEFSTDGRINKTGRGLLD
ncbi:MAG: transcription antitermination factor NusB [Saprospiraceae bacterium]|nr:transcription antitermination factor NusB [Saprospiraceae bacterium]